MFLIFHPRLTTNLTKAQPALPKRVLSVDKVTLRQCVQAQVCKLFTRSKFYSVTIRPIMTWAVAEILSFFFWEGGGGGMVGEVA